MGDYWRDGGMPPAGPSRGIPRKAEVNLSQEDADGVEFLRQFMLLRYDRAATTADVLRYAVTLASMAVWNGYGPNVNEREGT